jgi:hypothetical protein
MKKGKGMMAYRKKGIWMMSLQKERERTVSLKVEITKNDVVTGRKEKDFELS